MRHVSNRTEILVCQRNGMHGRGQSPNATPHVGVRRLRPVGFDAARFQQKHQTVAGICCWNTRLRATQQCDYPQPPPLICSLFWLIPVKPVIKTSMQELQTNLKMTIYPLRECCLYKTGNKTTFMKTFSWVQTASGVPRVALVELQMVFN